VWLMSLLLIMLSCSLIGLRIRRFFSFEIMETICRENGMVGLVEEKYVDRKTFLINLCNNS